MCCPKKAFEWFLMLHSSNILGSRGRKWKGFVSVSACVPLHVMSPKFLCENMWGIMIIKNDKWIMKKIEECYVVTRFLKANSMRTGNKTLSDFHIFSDLVAGSRGEFQAWEILVEIVKRKSERDKCKWF